MVRLIATILTLMIGSHPAQAGMKDDVRKIVLFVKKTGNECATLGLVTGPLDVPMLACLRRDAHGVQRFSYTGFVTIHLDDQNRVHCGVEFSDRYEQFGEFAYSIQCPQHVDTRVFEQYAWSFYINGLRAIAMWIDRVDARAGVRL